MRRSEREQLEGYRLVLDYAGYNARLLYNTRDVKFKRRIQLINRDTGESHFFARWPQAMKWLDTGVKPEPDNVIYVQGHRNTVERYMGSKKGHGRIVVIKDTGERSPEFDQLWKAIRWLEIVPY